MNAYVSARHTEANFMANPFCCAHALHLKATQRPENNSGLHTCNNLLPRSWSHPPTERCGRTLRNSTTALSAPLRQHPASKPRGLASDQCRINCESSHAKSLLINPHASGTAFRPALVLETPHHSFSTLQVPSLARSMTSSPSHGRCFSSM